MFYTKGVLTSVTFEAERPTIANVPQLLTLHCLLERLDSIFMKHL